MKRNRTIRNWRAEDVVDSFVFPIELSQEERKSADKDLAEARRKKRLAMTEQQKLELRLARYRLGQDTG